MMTDSPLLPRGSSSNAPPAPPARPPAAAGVVSTPGESGGGERRPARREPEGAVALVRILRLSPDADRDYRYFVPAKLRERVAPGCFVHVPFGRGNRHEVGVVRALEDAARENEPQAYPLKSVLGVREEVLTNLDEEQRALCSFLVERTFCSYGEAVRAILPPGALTRLEAVYSLPEDAAPEGLPPALLSALLRAGGEGRTAGQLARSLPGEDAGEALRELSAAGKLRVSYRLREEGSRRYREYARPTALAFADDLPPLRGALQKVALDYLTEHGTVELTALREATGARGAQIEALREKGLLALEREELYRDLSPREAAPPPDENILSPEQRAAAEELLRLAGDGRAEAALLFGVTGSGKTRVIKEVIDGVLASGRQVILLVPEISLTPQTVSLFSSFYGERVALLHSSLSDGERFDAWRRMKEGRASICVGTRSAVFAPFPRLGMIVIDEEQEHTYKSDSSPRYSARDVARFRCARAGALLLLSSATPSVESFYKASAGEIHLVRLRRRYGGAALPKCYLLDMRGRALPPGQAPLSGVLLGEMEKNLARGEQTILFAQRRGYHNYVRCKVCGEPIRCPNCSVSLTYHTHARRDPRDLTPRDREEGGYLLCHYCGARAPLPDACPRCGARDLAYAGYGTQMLEGQLASRFPGARILRMDADTTGSKFAFERMLSDFRARKYDILLGTQMVTKGHDFPAVTLVGVLCADNSLYVGDYRASERTFSLLTQVIGRGGRSKLPGRAIIQTYSPDNPVLRFAGEQNYEAFFADEAAARRALRFPPFCDIVLLALSGEDEGEVREGAEHLREILDGRLRGEFSDIRVVMYGPFEAPVYRLGGRYRRRILLKCRANRRARDLLRSAAEAFRPYTRKKVSLTIDINPANV